ncbi:multicopper oxidase [Laetiporus sulphureus 93-53]|uniref:Multicopper oxidase n=1 Tax=Laetiporus sulphureus 93-53 TaxID=1314785 RepID=A0A165EYN0_9APHY|nr:multicopper oxidase [Laetiporus sulphureus 93-53]KZT07992.1 multicopper oxidase [Laetiporus sulphureus 93-53]
MMWSAFALIAAAAPALAGIHEMWWNITYVEDINPDGLYPRRVIGVNGSWPLPAYAVNSTDSLVVHAHNSLDQPATLHHHGMFFNSTSWMDGAQQVGQCGIPPGEDFTYVVPINTSGQSGTYWVHSHAGGQYVDGLRSTFVINPEEEKYDYDEDYTIVIADWYHDQQANLLTEFISISNPGGAEPVPDAPLMYFLKTQTGEYVPPKAGSNPYPTTASVGFNENATLSFEAGKTYRLRVVNNGGFAGFFFWIDGHQMRIIEADGTDTEEYEIDQINLGVAQRYSILVTALNDTTANYAIHANFDTSMFDTVPDTLNPNATSYIVYNTSSSADVVENTVDGYLLTNDTLLVPYDPIGIVPATKTIPLYFEFDTMDDGTNHATVNFTTYNSPNVPSIMSMLTLGENATAQEAYGPNCFVVDHLDVVDIVLMNGDSNMHPFHLHGHTMQLVNYAPDYTNPPPINESQVNPMRRDTVIIPSGAAYTLRFIADNPGAWFFHCHIEWHLEVGLAVEIIEAPLIAQERNSMPSSMNDQCATLGKPYSGNAAGHASATDLSGLTTGPFIQNNGWHPRGIGAMFGCVFTAVLGMATVVWYALGGHISEAEIEHEERLRLEAKAARGRFFGLAKKVKKMRHHTED